MMMRDEVKFAKISFFSISKLKQKANLSKKHLSRETKKGFKREFHKI